MPKRILFPLPDRDFDVTEVSVPWKLLTEAGHQVVFATESGALPAADPLLLTGVLFGQLGAEAEPVAFYRELEGAAAFREPLRWSELATDDYDALFLAGGHAPGMRQYLGSPALQRFCADYWGTGRHVAAICHGVLVLARSRLPGGESVLKERRTTCLPKYMERTAYYITAWKLGKYYRTYPAYVEDEVKEALRSTEQFQRGSFNLTRRGTRDDDTGTFVVRDGNYLSARWPGDAYRIGKDLVAQLAKA
ncbi:MAG: DJ-1/PfpI family protein [Polyangiaceae bacterium]|nr:DJ-1/PfpI family protein [Polyangiaceae bacterium]